MFLPIFIEGQVPEVLAIGSAKPRNDSPWWKFHRLAHLVREDAENRVDLVRGQWAGQQRACFNRAYAIAEEGRLIDAGNPKDAGALLTSFMNPTVNRILAATDDLIKQCTRGAVSLRA